MYSPDDDLEADAAAETFSPPASPPPPTTYERQQTDFSPQDYAHSINPAESAAIDGGKALIMAQEWALCVKSYRLFGEASERAELQRTMEDISQRETEIRLWQSKKKRQKGNSPANWEPDSDDEESDRNLLYLMRRKKQTKMEADLTQVLRGVLKSEGLG